MENINDTASNLKEPVIASQPEEMKVETSTIIKTSKSQFPILPVLFGILGVSLILFIIGAVLIFNNMNKPTDNLIATKTITPVITEDIKITTQPSNITPVVTTKLNAIGKIDREQEILYVSDSNVYRYNFITKASAVKLPIGEVNSNGFSMDLGKVGPVLSPDGVYLAYGTDTGKVFIYNLATGTNTQLNVPSPSKGSTEDWFIGFSRNSSKLLFSRNCIHNVMGDAENLVDCDVVYNNQNDGFYTYDLKNQKLSRFYVENNHEMLGWAKYADDLVLVSGEDRDSNGSLKEYYLYEINATSSESKIIKKIILDEVITAQNPSATFADIDSNKNILWAYSGGSSTGWTLKYTPASSDVNVLNGSKTIVSVTSWVGMQHPLFTNSSSIQVGFNDTTAGAKKFFIYDLQGNKKLEVSSEENRPYSDTYYVSQRSPASVIQVNGWKTISTFGPSDTALTELIY